MMKDRVWTLFSHWVVLGATALCFTGCHFFENTENHPFPDGESTDLGGDVILDVAMDSDFFTPPDVVADAIEDGAMVDIPIGDRTVQIVGHNYVSEQGDLPLTAEVEGFGTLASIRWFVAAELQPGTFFSPVDALDTTLTNGQPNGTSYDVNVEVCEDVQGNILCLTDSLRVFVDDVIFVHGTAGISGNPGTVTLPVPTLNEALDLVAMRHVTSPDKVIRVHVATVGVAYVEDAQRLIVGANTEIRGGFDEDFIGGGVEPAEIICNMLLSNADNTRLQSLRLSSGGETGTHSRLHITNSQDVQLINLNVHQGGDTVLPLVIGGSTVTERSVTVWMRDHGDGPGAIGVLVSSGSTFSRSGNGNLRIRFGENDAQAGPWVGLEVIDSIVDLDVRIDIANTDPSDQVIGVSVGANSTATLNGQIDLTGATEAFGVICAGDNCILDGLRVSIADDMLDGVGVYVGSGSIQLLNSNIFVDSNGEPDPCRATSSCAGLVVRTTSTDPIVNPGISMDDEFSCCDPAQYPVVIRNSNFGGGEAPAVVMIDVGDTSSAMPTCIDGAFVTAQCQSDSYRCYGGVLNADPTLVHNSIFIGGRGYRPTSLLTFHGRLSNNMFQMGSGTPQFAEFTAVGLEVKGDNTSRLSIVNNTFKTLSSGAAEAFVVAGLGRLGVVSHNAFSGLAADLRPCATAGCAVYNLRDNTSLGALDSANNIVGDCGDAETNTFAYSPVAAQNPCRDAGNAYDPLATGMCTGVCTAPATSFNPGEYRLMTGWSDSACTNRVDLPLGSPDPFDIGPAALY